MEPTDHPRSNVSLVPPPDPIGLVADACARIASAAAAMAETAARAVELAARAVELAARAVEHAHAEGRCDLEVRTALAGEVVMARANAAASATAAAPD